MFTANVDSTASPGKARGILWVLRNTSVKSQKKRPIPGYAALGELLNLRAPKFPPKWNCDPPHEVVVKDKDKTGEALSTGSDTQRGC